MNDSEMNRVVARAPDSTDASWTPAPVPTPTPTSAVRLRRASSVGPTDAGNRGAASSLPPDLLRDASVRLGWVGLIYAAGYALAYWAPFVINRARHPELSLTSPQSAFAVLSIALGLAVFALSRRARLSPTAFLDVGLIFAVCGAFGISLNEFWLGFPPAESPLEYRGIPWECVWILIVPLVVPSTPRRILVASLAQASTGPIVIALVAIFRGIQVDAPVQVATYFAFTTYLCAGIAYVVAHIVYRYGVRLKKAQDIGSYVLVERIGEGGMGDVWVGRHRMLARPAAIKLIRPEVLGLDPRQSERAIARFEREARATAGLRSTHTVDVYDFGRTEDGAFFYVMELLEGLSLDELVRQFGPVPPARTVALLRQVCHSLQEAHEHGLIHRDVKPANIFVCRLGPDVDFVKVLDFGLVKEAHRETQITQPAMAAGTPAYMAPEVALGRDTIDGRADIYALGCVAYWLLTAEPVFHAPTSIATLLAHAQTAPHPPSRTAPFPVPADLDALVLACLSKSPAERPASAAELDRRLAAIELTDRWSDDDARAWWTEHLPAVHRVPN